MKKVFLTSAITTVLMAALATVFSLMLMSSTSYGQGFNLEPSDQKRTSTEESNEMFSFTDSKPFSVTVNSYSSCGGHSEVVLENTTYDFEIGRDRFSGEAKALYWIQYVNGYKTTFTFTVLHFEQNESVATYIIVDSEGNESSISLFKDEVRAIHTIKGKSIVFEGSLNY